MSAAPETTAAPVERKLLRRVSLCATLALTSHAEIAAALAAGIPVWHPWGQGGSAGLPLTFAPLLAVAVDCYAVDALERRQGVDRWAALGILALSVIGGSAYTADNSHEAVKAAGVGLVLVLVLARLYAAPPCPSRREQERLEEAAAEAAEKAAEAERRRHLEALRRDQEASELRVQEEARLAEIERQRREDETAADQRRQETAARIEQEREEAAARRERERLEAETAAEERRLRAAAELEAAKRRKRQERPEEAPSGSAGTTADRILAHLLKGAATAATLAASTGASPETVKTQLTALRKAGRVEPDPDLVHGWRLTAQHLAVAR
jgi:hypothetical protein